MGPSPCTAGDYYHRKQTNKQERGGKKGLTKSLKILFLRGNDESSSMKPTDDSVVTSLT